MILSWVATESSQISEVKEHSIFYDLEYQLSWNANAENP